MKRPERKRLIKTPRQDRSRFTVEQIMEAAAQVFTESGYAGATTNRIAERAGISIGSLYQYFPDKDALLLELVERHLRDGIAMLAGIFEQMDFPTIELEVFLKKTITAVLELHTRNPRLHYVLLSEAVWSSEAIAALHQMEDRVAAVVAWMLANHPQVRVHDPVSSAYLMVHMVMDLAHEYVVHPPVMMNEQEFIGEVVHLLKCYLTTKPHVEKAQDRQASDGSL